MITSKPRKTILYKGKKTEMLRAMTTAGKKKPCLNKFAKYFKSIDRFGEKIKFTYKGKKTYQTYIGAFHTLV